MSTTTSLPNRTRPGPLIESVPNTRRLRPASKRTPRSRYHARHHCPFASARSTRIALRGERTAALSPRRVRDKQHNTHCARMTSATPYRKPLRPRISGLWNPQGRRNTPVMDRELQSSHEQADDRLARDRRPGVTFDRSLLAHHSLANYNTTQAVRVKARSSRSTDQPSQHHLPRDTSDGQTRRWAAEGPSLLHSVGPRGQRNCRNPETSSKSVDTFPRNHRVADRQPGPGGRSISGRLINAETLTRPTAHAELG
jgi:hypothetical protein